MELTGVTADQRDAALIRLLSAPVFEVFPMAGVEDRMGHLSEGCKVSVTCSPTKGIEGTLALTEYLMERGFSVVPHIAARLVVDRDHLHQIGERLSTLGVSEIFVIGGDQKHRVGRFDSAFELLSSLAEAGHQFERVGVAAYPEGHPILEDATLLRALRDKQQLATYMVTQMCFDPEAIVSWVSEMRRRGITLPVHIGIPGAVKMQKLLRFSMRVGVGDSMRFLKKHTRLVAKIFRYAPDDVIAGLVPHISDRALGVQRFHIYTFNEIQSTEEWRRRLIGTTKEGLDAHSV